MGQPASKYDVLKDRRTVILRENGGGRVQFVKLWLVHCSVCGKVPMVRSEAPMMCPLDPTHQIGIVRTLTYL